MITQERLKEVLKYDPETGIFTWILPTATNISIGSIAGSISKRGYFCIGIDNKLYRSNRLAWLYMEGYLPENIVDHKNRIKTDDRWGNLRETSQQCNCRNRGLAKNNTSGIKGVSWYRKYDKWISRITVSEKRFNLGYYEDFDKAVMARWRAEVKYGFPNCESISTSYQYLKDNKLL